MGAVTVSSGEVVKIGSGGCSFCSISTLSLAEMTWEVLSTPADASQGHGVYAASEQHTLDAFGLEVVDGWRVESRTAILVDHEAGTWSIEDPPDDYRSGGIYARMHWTGSEFLIFGGRAAIPRDSPSDLEVAHYYDGILFDPVGRIWRRMEAARPDDLVARGDGGPSVASVWTSAGLFVWGTSAERTEAWGAIFDVETMTWEQLEVGEDAVGQLSRDGEGGAPDDRPGRGRALCQRGEARLRPVLRCRHLVKSLRQLRLLAAGCAAWSSPAQVSPCSLRLAMALMALIPARTTTATT